MGGWGAGGGFRKKCQVRFFGGGGGGGHKNFVDSNENVPDPLPPPPYFMVEGNGYFTSAQHIVCVSILICS